MFLDQKTSATLQRFKYAGWEENIRITRRSNGVLCPRPTNPQQPKVMLNARGKGGVLSY